MVRILIKIKTFKNKDLSTCRFRVNLKSNPHFYFWFLQCSKFNSRLQNKIILTQQLTICITSMPTWVLILTSNPPSSQAFNYAMTINKSHGQTLTEDGIYLPQSVFTHGQLYVPMSRVKSYNHLQFALASPSENFMAMTNYTNNVVFKSALIL